MSTDHRTSGAAPVHRLSGPDELLQAVPYLLGFHPADSLVVIGLDRGRLVVTARLDLADARHDGTLAHTLDAIRRGGATALVAVVYGPEGAPARWVDDVERAAAPIGADLLDVLQVRDGRWWSLACTSPWCCPPEGRAVPAGTSEFAAAATYAGLVALPDRQALAAQLDPLPDPVRDALDAPIAAAEHAAVRAVLEGRIRKHDRAVKRALFAAARASHEAGWVDPPDDDVARFAVALTTVAQRDAVWLAVDDRRLDGRPLWRALARRVPGPYDAAPLFLFGWASWRAGDGTLAGIAAERAVMSDPEYSAADLLLAALSQGLDPRAFPKLRAPRPA